MSERHPKYDQFVERNLELAERLLVAGFDDPALLEAVPDGATIVLLPDDDPELAAYNLELGLASIRRGRDVYFRHVRAVAPAEPAGV